MLSVENLTSVEITNCSELEHFNISTVLTNLEENNVSISSISQILESEETTTEEDDVTVADVITTEDSVIIQTTLQEYDLNEWIDEYEDYVMDVEDKIYEDHVIDVEDKIIDEEYKIMDDTGKDLEILYEAVEEDDINESPLFFYLTIGLGALCGVLLVAVLILFIKLRYLSIRNITILIKLDMLDPIEAMMLKLGTKKFQEQNHGDMNQISTSNQPINRFLFITK